MDYSLCDQTVTVYRNRGGEVTREVFQNAFLSIEEGVSYKDDARCEASCWSFPERSS